MAFPAQKLPQLLRHLGPNWLLFRLGYAARSRLGLLRLATPARPLASAPLAVRVAKPALTDPVAYLANRRAAAARVVPALPTPAQCAAWDAEGTDLAAIVGELRRGELRLFSGPPVCVGMPPAWHRNPLAGVEAPADRHWSRIGDFGHGDIKLIWEASRFSFAFALVRAYARVGPSEQFELAELFWSLFENWRDNNPPQQGPNWKCGQETSLRLVAWVFAAHAFAANAATTPARMAALAELVAVSAERVVANIDYALSQRNNHGVSEALGLFTAGLLFPELRGAAAWEARGRALLERLARQLFYADGGFVQHSLNYERLALHDYLWAIAVARREGRPLSSDLHERIRSAARLLFQLQDVTSGELPRYGHDDGALLFPLSGCHYHDYRPVLQTAALLVEGVRWFPPGPWDEEAAWLVGPHELDAPLEPPVRGDHRAETSGLFTVRSAEGFAFLHCGSFRDRPSQADLLHVDLWWRGQNVAIDAGTYSYNAPEAWDTSFSDTQFHNTVSVDGTNQMERAARFLWLPWARASAAPARDSSAGYLALWEGAHDGYTRLPAPATHRRALLRIADHAWLVLDELRSRGEHNYTLHWHLPDLPYTADKGQPTSITLNTAAGNYTLHCACLDAAAAASLVRAAPDTPRGWHAPGYSQRAPALSLDLRARGSSVRFWSVWSHEPCTTSHDGASFTLQGANWHCEARLGDPDQPLITTAILGGNLSDRL